MFGMAIASSSPAVAARCAHARAGAGAVATQNITDPALGPRILDRLAQGVSAQAALEAALAATPFGAYRQLLVIGTHGPPAIFSGAHALGLVSTARRRACRGGRQSAGACRCSERDAAGIRGGERALRRAPARCAARRRGARRRGRSDPFGGAADRARRELADRRSARRLERRGSDRGSLRVSGSIYAPQIDDYVRRAIDPGAGAELRCPRRLVKKLGGMKFTLRQLSVLHRRRGDRQHHPGVEARQHLAAGDFDRDLAHRARTRRAIVPAPSRAGTVADAGRARAAARREAAAQAGGGAVFRRRRHQPPDARRIVRGMVLHPRAHRHAGAGAILSQGVSGDAGPSAGRRSGELLASLRRAQIELALTYDLQISDDIAFSAARHAAAVCAVRRLASAWRTNARSN